MSERTIGFVGGGNMAFVVSFASQPTAGTYSFVLGPDIRDTAGRPMVDDPRDALECFGSAPVDALAIGPFLVRRAAVTRAA